MSVRSQPHCKWGLCSFPQNSRLVFIVHICDSCPAPQDTSRILCCSRVVSLGYPGISGHTRIFQVFPQNTISGLSSLHFGFNRDHLMNKVPVRCCFHLSCVCAVWCECVCACLIVCEHMCVGGCAHPHVCRYVLRPEGDARICIALPPYPWGRFLNRTQSSLIW